MKDGIIADDQEIIAPIVDAIYKHNAEAVEMPVTDKIEMKPVTIYYRLDKRTEQQKEKDRFLANLRHGKPKKWAAPIIGITRCFMRLTKREWLELAVYSACLFACFFLFQLMR